MFASHRSISTSAAGLAVAATRAARVADQARLERFLQRGADDGSYHVDPPPLTRARAGCVARCLAADGAATVDRIVAHAARARREPVLFALAMAAKLGDEPTRRAAYAAVPTVCRDGLALLAFAAHAQGFGGWGRGMRRAVAAWFHARSAADLAHELARAPSRDGWFLRDLLRLAHPRAATPAHDQLFAWAVSGALPPGAGADPGVALIAALGELRATTDPAAAAALIRAHAVPHEAVPGALLAAPAVWDALLAALPVPALLAELPAMTRVGLVAPRSEGAARVVEILGDRDRWARAGIHPFALLAAQLAYRAGRSARDGAWQPVAAVVDALEAAADAAIAALPPPGRTLVALDTSVSMSRGAIARVPGLTPAVASAAMALITARSGPASACVAFTAAGLAPVAIGARDRLADVVAATSALPPGGARCALPMRWAAANAIDVDAFVIYTDDDTWAGDVHPAQALRDYRNARGIPASLVVVGMTSDGFSVADPDDAGMLDVVGFDASVPPVIADLARA